MSISCILVLVMTHGFAFLGGWWMRSSFDKRFDKEMNDLTEIMQHK